MHFECPGCGESTPDVVAEGGKPVYCTQCGRGYRFIYGFFHRYLYFVFNHPILTYALLLVFALMLSRTFPGSQKLLYLVFYSVFYWTLLRWSRRTYKYLEPLPTGPLAAPHPPQHSPILPASPPPPKAGSPSRAEQASLPVQKTRLPFFTVTVFLLNLLLFPAALFVGFVSLQAVAELLLDLIHGSGGGSDLIDFLSEMHLGHFREGIALYSVVVVLTSLFFLGVNILSLSVVRARQGHGKELVIWSFIFWIVSTLLMGSQIVSGWNMITDWQSQEKQILSKPDRALELATNPLSQWTQLHAWRRNPKPKLTLFFFENILNNKISVDHRYAWVTRGLAIDLASRTIRDIAIRWKVQPENQKSLDIARLDRICNLIIKDMETHPDRTIRNVAEKALHRLRRLPFRLPKSEARLIDSYLYHQKWPDFNVLKLTDFGSGKVALDKTVEMIASSETIPIDRWIGPILRSFMDQNEVAHRLSQTYEETESDEIQHNVLLATTFLKTKVAIPLILKGLEEGGTLRFKSLQALYDLFRNQRLPKDLSRVRRYYYQVRYSAKKFDTPKYDHVHKSTARVWKRYLSRGRDY